jgi:hypothetical protein
MGSHLLYSRASDDARVSLSRDTDAAALVTDPWSLADCEEGLGGPWRCTLQPETNRFVCRILARKLISIGCQPLLIAASRCYLIQMLR